MPCALFAYFRSMRQTENQIINRFKGGVSYHKSTPCEIIRGIKPGIYPSISSAAKANRLSRSTLYDIAHGKFRRDGIEVRLLES